MGKRKIVSDVLYHCKADEHLTRYNKERNKEVYSTCIQQPKFNVGVSCRGCTYLYTKAVN